MIKCVLSDIDGTLLHGGQTEIDPAVFTQIARLRAQGILFCPASGRQYQSLRRLFAPIADEICYICENASVVYGVGNPGEILSKSVLPTTQALRLCADILATDSAELVISGVNACYICPKEVDLTDHLVNNMGNRAVTIPTPSDVPEEMIKVCLFAPNGMTPALYDLQARWCGTFNALVSGKQWMDFTLSDKSDGVHTICAHFGIAPEEILAVGDNYNDVKMLGLVGQPYLMENAVPELKAQFTNHCSDVAELLATLGI